MTFVIRRNIYDYFFLLVLVAVLSGIVALLLPFAGALLSAFAFAVIFYPIYRWLCRRIPRASSSVRAGMADALVVMFFVVPIVILTWAVVRESTTFQPVVYGWMNSLNDWRHGTSGSLPAVHHGGLRLAHWVGVQPSDVREHVLDWINDLITQASVISGQLATHAIFFLIDMMIMLFSLFFMLRDGERLLLYLEDLIPMRREDKRRLASRIRSTVVGVIRGWLLTAVAQGAIATVGYAIVGTPGSVLLGLLTTLSGLIPVLGTFGIWIPVGIFYLAHGFIFKGLFVLAWGTFFIVGFIDTMFRPYLIGRGIQLSIFPLFFALLGGVEVWGAKGVILGPLLIAISPILLEIYRQRYLRIYGGNVTKVAEHDHIADPALEEPEDDE